MSARVCGASLLCIGLRITNLYSRRTFLGGGYLCWPQTITWCRAGTWIYLNPASTTPSDASTLLLPVGGCLVLLDWGLFYAFFHFADMTPEMPMSTVCPSEISMCLTWRSVLLIVLCLLYPRRVISLCEGGGYIIMYRLVSYPSFKLIRSHNNSFCIFIFTDGSTNNSCSGYASRHSSYASANHCAYCWRIMAGRSVTSCFWVVWS